MSDTTTPGPFGATPATMSSREIADLCETRHNQVVETIERLFSKGVLRESRKTTRPFSPPGGGRPTDVYDLTKRDTLVVVAGYDDALRAKIIDRWMELEATAAPAPINVRDIGQLSRIALQLIEVNQELTHRAEAAEAKIVEVEVKAAAAEARIEADKPKTGFFDRFMNADGVFGLQNAGRILVEPPNKFIRWLKEGFLFYQGGSLVPRAQYRSMGIFEVKATMVDDKARYQTYVTPKGLQYLAKKLGKDIPGLGAGA